jgi:membrane associated rhomboid family serine protease
MRSRTGSTLCPSCGQLVGVNDSECLGCGRRNPGMWGFSLALRGLGRDLGFVPLVLWGCGAAYLATLAADPTGIEMGGILSLVSPSIQSLFLFGASGAVPVFRFGRWWTVLSASWLHGGILHILFNMMWIRNLAPATVELYGAARTVIIYVVGGAVGFLASSLAGQLAILPGPLRGAGFTVGASAPLFALLGALLHYGHRSGSRHVTEQVKGMALGMLLFGFILPGIDNWAHLGGLGGGYIMARWLDPLLPERGNHMVAAVLCLAFSLAAILASVVSALPIFRA